MRYMTFKAVFLFLAVAIQLYSSSASAQQAPELIKSTAPIYSHQYTYLDSDYYFFIDTSFNSLHWYHQFNHPAKDLFDYNRLGSMGNPMNLLSIKKPDNLWNYNSLGAYSPYFKTQKDIRYYQTTSPLTEANYWMGYDRGQSFNIYHTQNINKHWNFLINYKRLNDLGYYNHNRNIQSTFLANMSYVNDESGYRAHTYFLNEKLNTEENGGLVEDSLVDQKILLNVNLSTDTREMRNREFFIDQNLSLGQIFSRRKSGQDSSKEEGTSTSRRFLNIGHSFKYTASYNKYRGDAPAQGQDGFYANYYFDQTGEYLDSSHYRSYSNTVYLESEVGHTTKLNLKAGLRNLYTEYSQVDYLLVNGGWGLVGNVDGRIKDIVNVKGSLDYILTGALKESFALNASGKLKPLKWLEVFGGYSLRLRYPDFFDQMYFSNNYIWQNNFKKQASNIINYGIGWGKNNKLEISNVIYSNYTYYDSDVQPQQSEANINVLKAELVQNFSFFNFIHQDNRIIFQSVGGNAEVLPLPKWKTRNSLYFEFFLFNRALKCLAGGELNYFSSYYSPSYDPATARFYNARERKIGDYPMFDLFANFELRTARIFVKYEHVNEGLNGSQYFAAPHYAFPDRALRIGITWRFFN